MRSLETNQRGPDPAQARIRQGSEDGDKTEKTESFQGGPEDRAGNNRKGFKMAAHKTGWELVGQGVGSLCQSLGRDLQGKGAVLSANHSPSSLWGHGDRPCLGLPETQARVSRLEAEARSSVVSGKPGHPRGWTADGQSDRAFISNPDWPSQPACADQQGVGLWV